MDRMNKKGQAVTVGLLMLLAVGLIVAFALFPSIVDTTHLMTSKLVQSNQSVSLVSAYVDANDVNESKNFTLYSQSAWKEQSCPLVSVSIKNATGTALVKGTDYTLYADQGVFSLLNTSSTVPAVTKNVTYGYYSYCADGYNKDSGSRGIAGIIPLFAALAVLGFVAVGLKNDWFSR